MEVKDFFKIHSMFSENSLWCRQRNIQRNKMYNTNKNKFVTELISNSLCLWKTHEKQKRSSLLYSQLPRFAPTNLCHQSKLMIKMFKYNNVNTRKRLTTGQGITVHFRQQCFPFILHDFNRSWFKTQSFSCACPPSCSLSGWTARGLSAGPAACGPPTASLPAASLWMHPCAHTTQTD